MSKVFLCPVNAEANGDIEAPEAMTEGSAGFDIRAAVTDPVVLRPGQRALIPSGWRMALPPGYEAQVRPRSGLALKHGVTVLNSPGTIDADYRGEVGVILINHGERSFTVKRGERIAQLVFARLTPVTFQTVESLPESSRGGGGFGHTGL